MTSLDDPISRLLSELHSSHREQWRSKTNTLPVRIGIIASIGKKANDDAVAALMRVIEGGTATWTPKVVRTLWRQLPIRYDLDDQRTAVEVIAESGSAEALRFLRRKYYACRFVQKRHFPVASQGVEWVPASDIEAVCWTYPFAPTELRPYMEFHILLSHTYGSGASTYQLPTPADQFRREVERHLTNRWHMTFKSSIAKLETAVGVEESIVEESIEETAWLIESKGRIEKEQRASGRPSPIRFLSRGEDALLG